MNVVAALGELEAQFCCHNATAAVGRIAGDADLHSTVSGRGSSIRLWHVGRDSDFTREKRELTSEEKLRKLSGGFEGIDSERVGFVQMILYTLLRVGRQTNEFDAHSYTWVTCPDDG